MVYYNIAYKLTAAVEMTLPQTVVLNSLGQLL